LTSSIAKSVSARGSSNIGAWLASCWSIVVISAARSGASRAIR
jgi:hypothetical protein